MRAAVITHHFPHEQAVPAIARLREVAVQHNCELIFDEIETGADHHPGPGAVTPVADFGGLEIDVAIVLGGDGSILRALRTFAGTGVPTFGINYGAIGFLATTEPEQLEDGLRRALTGDFEVRKLPALRVRCDGIDMLAVNDITFGRAHEARVAEISYALAGHTVGRVRCDGLVAATPAGSTGYNLANSGPILAWGVEGYVVSFIAPHTLTARAMVAAPDDVLTVVNGARRDELEVMVDGLIVGRLPVGEKADLTFEDDVAALAQLPGSSFYARFREKFGKLAS